MRWILGTALVVGTAMTSPAMSSACATTIEVNDEVRFDRDEITVDRSCESFSLTLKHTGTLGAAIMGHNWVLTTSTDYMSVANAGASAGAAREFVPVDDARVLAATRIIGGGEETTISFEPSLLEAGGDYTFFCSFPGHYAAMSGKLIVE